MQKPNYLETVGLILVGFGLYETIYTKPRASPMAIEWGLTSEFDLTRFLVVVLICSIVAISLIMIQMHHVDRAHPPSSVSDALNQLKRAFFDWRSKLAPLALGMQFFAVGIVLSMFSLQAASALLIGFTFVDVSLLLEKRGYL